MSAPIEGAFASGSSLEGETLIPVETLTVTVADLAAWRDIC